MEIITSSPDIDVKDEILSLGLEEYEFIFLVLEQLNIIVDDSIFNPIN